MKANDLRWLNIEGMKQDKKGKIYYDKAIQFKNKGEILDVNKLKTSIGVITSNQYIRNHIIVKTFYIDVKRVFNEWIIEDERQLDDALFHYEEFK